MKDCQLWIEENTPIAPGVFRMRLQGEVEGEIRPGQFLDLRLDGLYLRRPISLCTFDKGSLTILYKVVGKGTALMSAMRPGEALWALVPLGNGFDVSLAGPAPLLLGGGIGSAPLLALAERLRSDGRAVQVALGFNSAQDVILSDEFAALGCRVEIATLDGSRGRKGFVTDAMPETASYFYACGPEPMLRAVYRAAPMAGEMSFEARMGCGFGACMGCSFPTKSGSKRICKDGPVLKKEELPWDD